jgi:hypothetical protein
MAIEFDRNNFHEPFKSNRVKNEPLPTQKFDFEGIPLALAESSLKANMMYMVACTRTDLERSSTENTLHHPRNKTWFKGAVWV